MARFRAHGEVKADLEAQAQREPGRSAAAENGGTVVTCNDAFRPQGQPHPPGRALTMGEGWRPEEARAGTRLIVVRLCAPGRLRRSRWTPTTWATTPRASLAGCNLAEPSLDVANATGIAWREALTMTRLQGHTRHFFEKELKERGPFTHLRLNIYPDGGISRLRAFGFLE